MGPTCSQKNTIVVCDVAYNLDTYGIHYFNRCNRPFEINHDTDVNLTE